MAVDRSDFIAAGASLNTNWDDFWANLENAIKALAALYVAKKTHGTPPNDILSGLYLGDDTLTTERNWRIYSDSSGRLNIDRNTGSEGSPTWTNRLQMSTAGAFLENAHVKTGAAIDRAKLASGNAYRVIVNDATGAMSQAAALTASRVLLSDSNGVPTVNAALTASRVLRASSASLPESLAAITDDRVVVSHSSSTLTHSNMSTTQANAIGDSSATVADLDRIPGARLRLTFEPAGPTTWANMPAALTFYNGTLGAVQKVDLTKYTQVRLLVNKLGTAGAATSKIRLLYRTAYDATVGNYNTIGTSEVECAVNVTNTFIDSGYINLASPAKADVFVALSGINGDGAIDPIFGSIVAEFK